MLISLRDNGIVFNPIEYSVREEEYKVDGIMILKNISQKISYKRVLALNQTIIDLYRLAGAIEKAVASHPAMNVRIAERDGEPFQEFSAEDYHQTVEKMSEAAWQKKKCPNSLLNRLNFTAGSCFVSI